MTDTYKQVREKKGNLTFLNDLILEAVELEDYTQALKISKKALDLAREEEKEDWISRFKELNEKVYLHIVNINYKESPNNNEDSSEYSNQTKINTLTDSKIKVIPRFEKKSSAPRKNIKNSSDQANYDSFKNLPLTPQISSSLTSVLNRNSELMKQPKKKNNFVNCNQIQAGELNTTEVQEIQQNIAEIFINMGYYIASNNLKNKSQNFPNIDQIACKIIQINELLDIVLVIPIKVSKSKESLIVEEQKIGFSPYKNKLDQNSIENNLVIEKEVLDFLENQNQILDDLINEGVFFEFIRNYLQVDLSIEKSFEHKKLFFTSGRLQFKFFFDPILITSIPPGFIEKSIPFAYQKAANLHITSYNKLSELLYFLEKKHKLVELYSVKGNDYRSYQYSIEKFKKYLRLVSFPFIGFGIFILIVSFLQSAFLSKLVNSIGYGSIGVYLFSLGYLYFLFYKKKLEISNEFNTPYYQKEIIFDEGDLFVIKNELSSDLMAQFGYECFGKEHHYDILDELEKENMSNNIENQTIRGNIDKIYEYGVEALENYNNHKLVKKYSSFLDE